MPTHGAIQAVSICICTYNRERLLRQTLARLERCDVPDDIRLEIVVIDNNSTDGTSGVIEDAATRLPIRTAKETRPGIAPARNAAVANSRGDLLLWTDDDVLVEADWIRRYVAAARSNPDTGIFGGPVRPYFEGTPPPWVVELLPDVRQAYALRDFPEGLSELDVDHLPYGANFATRRQVHTQVQFDPALGRVGSDGGCLNEESAFFEAAMALGYTARWIPECPVQHVIPVERQAVGYLRRYYKLSGATPLATPSTAKLLFGRPRWLWREWMLNEIAFLLLRYTSRPPRWFSHLKRASYARGALFARPRA